MDRYQLNLVVEFELDDSGDTFLDTMADINETINEAKDILSGLGSIQNYTFKRLKDK